jgi:hypothetical protein
MRQVIYIQYNGKSILYPHTVQNCIAQYCDYMTIALDANMLTWKRLQHIFISASR